MTILNSIFRDICLYARRTIYFHLQYDYVTLHLTRSRNFSSKNCAKRVVASIADIEMCHENYSMSRKTKKHTYGWWKHLPPPSFRSCRGRNGVIMPNGTGNSRNFQISGKKDNLWRLSKIFEMSSQKRSVPFDFVPEFPEILAQWIAP